MAEPTVSRGKAKIISGKIEKFVGTLLCSPAMKMEGRAKVQLGRSEKLAAEHLRDADRLERAATKKRELAGIGPGVQSTAQNVRGMVS